MGPKSVRTVGELWLDCYPLGLYLAKPEMFPTTGIHARLLLLELQFICRTAFLKRVPVVRSLHRKITADLNILKTQEDLAVAFTVRFRSPYFRLPVPLEKAQIGEITPDGGFQPTSFRFFDWQTWAHIEGVVEWCGEHRVQAEGEEVDFITGFSYRVAELPAFAGNLGLRLAEGVEGMVRVSCGAKIARVQFDPVYWLLEATGLTFRPVPIRSNKLMGLIVPLFDLGRGDPRVFDSAVDRVQRWAELNLDDRKPFRQVLPFLRHITRWGPLGMKPAFRGIVLTLERLQVPEIEQHLFDFFADNWGVWGNRNGRLLAVRLLEALATERAKAALKTIIELVRNQEIAADELDLIRTAVGSAEAKSGLTVPERTGD